MQQYAHRGKGVTVVFCGDWDLPAGASLARWSSRWNATATAHSTWSSGRSPSPPTTSAPAGSPPTTPTPATSNFARYREECPCEGIEPHTAVEVEALRPGLLRQRLGETIEGPVDDVRQWNIEFRTESAERELLRELHGAVKNMARGKSPIENEQDE
ncbi:hypothetical protein ABZS79_34685 [Streptomyces griseoloalbus]|uniref:hypothetical protein n=1 Tax=Streptomyces griseoloalbus TaxID=67303 RepID=UPI0033BC120B